MSNVIDGMPDFKVTQGYSAETSGGIMTMLEPAKAKDFIAELEQDYGQKAWIIGKVINGSQKAMIRQDADVIEVSESFMLK